MPRKKNKTKGRGERPEKHYDDSGEQRVLVYEIFRRSNRTVYHVRGSQAKYVDKIILDGYAGLQSGLYLYKSGYGFQKKGTFLLSALKSNLAPTKLLEVVVTRQGKKGIRKQRHKIIVTIPFIDVKNLLLRLGRINEDSNNEIREVVLSFLGTKFPRAISVGERDFDDYAGGEVAALLRRKSVIKKMNQEDLESLKTFFPELFATSFKGKRKAVQLEKQALMQQTKLVSEKTYLDEVIEEFEKKLKSSTSESAWQVFLRGKVFNFLSNYACIIEKQNIDIGISIPDFLLVDVYGYVDVFEIKRHVTPLLSYDNDRENYYWKSDISKAISQTENYIESITKNASEFAKVVRRKKSIDLQVVRPRGYIVAGQSNLFQNKTAAENYRMLSRSLTNTTFILFDELLAGLKNLRTKL